MKVEERYCSTCRAVLPAGAAWCEKCGTDAGKVFDGKMPRRKSSSRVWIAVLLALVAAGVGVFLYRDDVRIPNMLRSSPKFDTGPVRVVGQRPGGTHRAPGAKLNQPEAIRTLREYLVAHNDVKSECLAVAARGFQGGAYTLDAVDSCHTTKLGRWRVDGRTGEVGR
jgi:hypothetical protein